MKIEGYGAFNDPYVYPGTTVLKNLLGIQSQDQLEAFEVEITTLRAEEPLPLGDFDAPHYCRIHHHLFQDVYKWAGQYRTVRISKGSNAFCYPENIAEQMSSLFAQLQGGEIFRKKRADDFAREAARFLGELNAIHPFREGNGRSQLSFVGLIGASFEHPFAMERVQKSAFLPAMIASYTGNSELLAAELKKLLD